MPEEMPWADPVVVPDDIRSLQAEIDAYHREVRADRRRRRRERLTGTWLWRRWSFPLGVMTGAVALAAAVATVLAVDGASRPGHPHAVPLATATVAPGQVGGLLPSATLTTTTGAHVSSRALRPALLVLLPAHCDCAKLLDSLAAQAAEVQVDLAVVGSGSRDAEVAALPGQLHHGPVIAAYDAAGTLASAYNASGVTALVVQRDGVVSYVRSKLTASSRLELPLQAALLLGSGTTS
jgi:hypothetical protein